MVAVLKIYDADGAAQPAAPALELAVEAPSIRVEALIRRRVEEELRAYHEAKTPYYQGLITPPDAERTLNGVRPRKRRRLDVERQVALAIEAFKSNGFFLLVGDRQVESLDERIDLEATDAVTFVKLVPLVGG